MDTEDELDELSQEWLDALYEQVQRDDNLRAASGAVKVHV